MDPNFVSGFVTGEGSFYLSIERTQAKACFMVNVRDDDRDLLEQVRSTIGDVGKVYLIRNTKYAGRYDSSMPGTKDSRRWMVRKSSECRGVLVPFFDKYPLGGRKLNSYRLWKQALALILADEHKTAQGKARLLALQAEMNHPTYPLSLL